MAKANGARRVVVTGTGVVTPIGLTVDDFWASMKAGKCGVTALGGFPLEDLKILIAAQIKDFDPKARLKHFQRDKLVMHADRYSWFAAAAADEAVKQSGLAVPDRRSLPLGLHRRLGRRRPRHLREVLSRPLHRGQARHPSADAAAHHRLLGQRPRRHRVRRQGPDLRHLLACSTATHAIGIARDYIRNDIVDVAIAGASEVGHQLRHHEGLAGAARAVAGGLLPVRQEAQRHRARRRRRHPRARVARARQGARRQDPGRDRRLRHVVGRQGHGQPRHRGPAARPCASRSRMPSLAPSDIDYLNAHGTATTINDANETRAIKEVFGNHAKNLAISSTKSMHGHPLGAGGGIEAVACIKAMQRELGAADHRPRRGRSRVRPRLHPQRRPRPEGQLRDVELLRLRRPQRGARLRAAARLKRPPSQAMRRAWQADQAGAHAGPIVASCDIRQHARCFCACCELRALRPAVCRALQRVLLALRPQ